MNILRVAQLKKVYNLEPTNTIDPIHMIFLYFLHKKTANVKFEFKVQVKPELTTTSEQQPTCL